MIGSARSKEAVEYEVAVLEKVQLVESCSRIDKGRCLVEDEILQICIEHAIDDIGLMELLPSLCFGDSGASALAWSVGTASTLDGAIGAQLLPIAAYS